MRLMAGERKAQRVDDSYKTFVTESLPQIGLLLSGLMLSRDWLFLLTPALVRSTFLLEALSLPGKKKSFCPELTAGGPSPSHS